MLRRARLVCAAILSTLEGYTLCLATTLLALSIERVRGIDDMLLVFGFEDAGWRTPIIFLFN